jgi:hypothetical protein
MGKALHSLKIGFNLMCAPKEHEFNKTRNLILKARQSSAFKIKNLVLINLQS